MKPDLEPVQACGGQSFRAWSHGHPHQSVQRHCHPEFELHLVAATEDDRHVEDCCLVLQFTGEFIAACMAAFPELRFVQPLLDEEFRGVRFDAGLAERIEPLVRDLLVGILDLIGQVEQRASLAGAGPAPNPAARLSPTMNLVLRHIARDLSDTDLARRSRQSASTPARSFRKHAGTTFIHYVNSLRIELACQHLSQADLAISGVCYAVGLNVSNFNRRRLAAKGMPPSRFRTRRRDRRRFASAA